MQQQLTIILVCIYPATQVVIRARVSKSMYICVCHAISDRQIREAVDRGAGSLCEVQAYLPVAGCCGRCEDSARQVIEAHVESTTRPQAA
jgi:bacterioferritin-associated ferredoxin